MSIKKFSTFIAILVLPTLASIAQSIQGLGFSSEKVRPNETIKYTIVFKDIAVDIKLDDLPIPDGLTFVGTSSENRFSMSSRTGTSREKRVIFSFIPTREGTFEIPEWKIEAGGKIYTIAAAKFAADKNAPQMIRQTSRSIFDDDDDFFNASPLSQMMSMQRTVQSRQANNRNHSAHEEIDLNKEISISAMLPKNEIFVGQAIPVELKVSVSRKIINAGYGFANPAPAIKDSDSFQSTGFANGQKPQSIETDTGADVIFKTTITPIKAGEQNLQFELGGLIVQNDPFANSFFGMGNSLGAQQFTIFSQPQKVEVKELPKENMPSDFSGAIGSFKIEGVKLDETSLSVGEPCTFTVKISGEGNFERMLAPKLTDKDGWKEYKPKFTFLDESGGEQTKGTKTFEFTLLAQKPDIEFAPLAHFSYFDPIAKEYKTLSSEKIPVSVAPSKSYSKAKLAKEEAQSEAKNPLDSIGENSNGTKAQSLAANPLFWGLQVLILAGFCALYFYKSKQNKLMENPAYARTVKAQRALKNSLALAQKASKSSDAREFFKAAESALQAAISTKSDMDYSAITLSDSLNIFGGNKDFDAELSRIKFFFEGADAIAFAGLNPSSDDLGKLYEELSQLCKKISQN